MGDNGTSHTQFSALFSTSFTNLIIDTCNAIVFHLQRTGKSLLNKLLPFFSPVFLPVSGYFSCFSPTTNGHRNSMHSFSDLGIILMQKKSGISMVLIMPAIL